MITGAHSIIYSAKAEADREFLRDVLGFPSVDVGHGWLIFGLPPAEVAVHPGDGNDTHELYLMCEDVEAFVVEMKLRGVECGPVRSMGWGELTHVTLPGGGKLGVYQPRHARPEPVPARAAGKPGAKKAARKAGGRTPARRRPAGKKTAKKKAVKVARRKGR